MSATTLALPSDEAQRLIQAERTHQAFSLALYGHPSGVLAAGVLALGLWMGGGPALGLGLWLLAKLAVLAAEAVVARAYFKADEAARRAPAWEHRLGLTSVLLGGLWGLLPLLMMPSDARFEMLVVVTLIGIGTASLGSLATSPRMYYTYVTPALLGLVAACLVRGGTANLTMATLVLVCLGFLAMAQRALAAQFAERVLTRLRLQQADSALQKSLTEFELLFDLASVGIAEVRQRTIVRANVQLETLLGYAHGTMLGQPISILYASEATHETFNEIRDPLVRGLTVERDMQIKRRDGSLLWVALASRAIDPNDAPSGVIVVFTDITDRRERESAMHRLAHEDALTGLPNRRLLEDRLRQALIRARRRGGCVALLLLDLDGFKRINDNHGHEAGDQLLAEVGQRLLGCVRGSDTVSRIGGDEFVVLLDDPIQPDDAGRIAQKLVAATSEPFAFGAHVLRVGASVGVSVAPYDSLDAEVLLRCADEAMYRAKQSGRGAWRHYADGSPAG